MVVVTVQEDGRIRLPDAVRERLELHPGTRLVLEEADDRRELRLRALPEEVELVEQDGMGAAWSHRAHGFGGRGLGVPLSGGASRLVR